jgi:hypothetical protein
MLFDTWEGWIVDPNASFHSQTTAAAFSPPPRPQKQTETLRKHGVPNRQAALKSSDAIACGSSQTIRTKLATGMHRSVDASSFFGRIRARSTAVTEHACIICLLG